MAGRKVPYDITFLTSRVVYRTNITAADASPDLDTIPAIAMDIDASKLMQNPGAGVADNYEVAGRAYNAHLEIFAHFTRRNDCPAVSRLIYNTLIAVNSPTCHATLRVWCYSLSQAGDDITPVWVVVHEQSIVTNTLITLRDIPAGSYKITVDDISANCRVDLLEQHTE
jgi:hypothetical protein